jgi:L-ribulose-5-phosphate 3-epimerase
MSQTLPYLNRLGVCSWSLKPADPEDLIKKVAQTGLTGIQIALDPMRIKPLVWGEIGEAIAAAGMNLLSGMFGAVGEDYSTLESIRRTGGLVPDETWEANWKNIQQNARLACALKLPLVTFHAGFLPHEEDDPRFRVLIDRLRRVADLFGENGIALGLETGQETAGTLRYFLEKPDRPNLGVNFDPANMLIYDMGDPIESLQVLLPHLKQCHIKDASRPTDPGTKGKEELAGTGEVNWKQFFLTLRKAAFKGNLVIEREKGDERVADVRKAVALVQQES